MKFLRRRQRWFRERMWQARCQRVAAARELGEKQKRAEQKLKIEMAEWRQACEKRQQSEDAWVSREASRHGLSLKQMKLLDSQKTDVPLDLLVRLIRRMAGINPECRRHRDLVLKELVESLDGKSGPYKCSPDDFDDAVKVIEGG